MEKSAVYFLALGAALFLLDWAATSLFMLVGDRMARRLRRLYLRALLRQDRAFFLE